MLRWWLRALVHASAVLIISISSMAPSAAMGADLVSGVRAAFACPTPAGCIGTPPGAPVGVAGTGIAPPGEDLGLSTTPGAAVAGAAAQESPGGASRQVPGPTIAAGAGTGKASPGQPSNVGPGGRSGTGSTTATGSTGAAGGTGTDGTSGPNGSTEAGTDTAEPSPAASAGQAEPTPPASVEPGESSGSPSASGAPAATGSIVTVVGDGTTSAAQNLGWGPPAELENFDSGLAAWEVLNGVGNAGKGRRSPAAVTVRDGLLTIAGDAEGVTGELFWSPGSRYGRWEVRMRAPRGDPTYHALLRLQPDAEGAAADGGIDFAEMADPARRVTDANLRGAGDARTTGAVRIDATQWHNWAVEWTPRGITTYVDGQQWWSVSDTSILPPGPLRLALQLDRFSGAGTVTPTEMVVDRVAFYPADPAAELGTTSTPSTSAVPSTAVPSTAAPSITARPSPSSVTTSRSAPTTEAPPSAADVAPMGDTIVTATPSAER